MNETHLEKALDYVAAEARHLVMDSLACELHNTWATLEANKPEEDVEWLAHNLYQTSRNGYANTHWQNLSEEIQAYWRDIASKVIELLPLFCGRVANRYDAARKAMEEMARVERSARRQKAHIRTKPERE